MLYVGGKQIHGIKFVAVCLISTLLISCKNTNISVPLISSPSTEDPTSPSGPTTAAVTTITNLGIATNTNDYAYASALQSDGKLIVSGTSLSQYENYHFFATRYNTDGTIDTSFGSNGTAISYFNSGSSGKSYASAVQADGKILIAGTVDNDFGIVRLTSSGSLDSSFGTGGKVETDIGTSSTDDARAMVVQGDGKIILAGKTNSGGSNNFAVVRYNADGSLDASFGTGGKIITDIGTNSNDGAMSMALQADGKIIVSGNSDSAGAGLQDFAAVRYTTAGALDATFGTGGIVITDVFSASETATSTVIQPDGKILLGGNAFGLGTMARYTTSGALDNTFGTGGTIAYGHGLNLNYPNTILLLGSGKILHVGHTGSGAGNEFMIARYNADGSIDNTWGTAGAVFTTNAAGIITYSALLQADGSIAIFGQTPGTASDTDLVATRYDSSGNVDASFGTAGIVKTDVKSPSYDSYKAHAAQSDGKIVAVGYTNANTPSKFNFFIARYNTDGSLDSTFGSSGFTLTDINNSADRAEGLVIQSDGKIVVAGTTDSGGSNNFAVVRYNSDGSLDTSFGTAGKVTTDFGGNSYELVFGVKLQSDGKIIVAGSSDLNGSDDFAAARYTTAGVLDATFGTGGKTVVDIANLGNWDTAYQVAVASDDKIILAGTAQLPNSYDFGAVRLNANGTIDTSFGTNGIVTKDIGGSDTDDYVEDMVLQSDGKILITGGTDLGSGFYDFATIRLSVNGALDATFGTGGVVTTDIGTTTDDGAAAITLQSDGKIVVGGTTNTGASYDIVLVKYSSSGVLDTSFATSGKYSVDIGTNSRDFISSLVVQSDGMIAFVAETDSTGSNELVLKRISATGQ